MLSIIHFLHPEFLYGLFILVIPVILHLFSFKKYKKIYFSNFNFLAALQQQKKNSSKLKNILLLLLRLITIAAIITAFAYPYYTPRTIIGTQGEKPQIVIYVDNSFSMSNTGTKGTLFEEAKKHAYDIVNSYPAGTAFYIITNDNIHHIAFTQTEMPEILGNLKTTSRAKDLSTLFKETRELSAGKRTTLFLLSDFQKHNCDFQHISNDSLTEPVFLILQPENLNNLYIKEITFPQVFHKKDQNDRIAIKIVNSSDKDFTNVPVNLTINDKKKSISKINIPAKGEQDLDISYLNTEEGFYKGVIEISDFPVIFDNKFYFSYAIDPKINILTIEEKQHSPFFGKLFSDTTAYTISYINVNQTANVNFKTYNLIILDRLQSTWTGLESELENYVTEGGNLFVIPDEYSAKGSLNKFMQKLHAPLFITTDTNTSITGIEKQAFLFKDVFENQESNSVLPSIKHFYKLQLPQGTEKLLEDKRGNVLLCNTPYGQGNIYLSAFDYDPQNSDMVYHPLFVPVMVNMAYNVNTNPNGYWTIQKKDNIHINNKQISEGSRLQIKSETEDLEFIPETRKDFSGNLLLLNAQNIEQAGLYHVLQDDKTIDVLAFNYDRTESQLYFCNEKELQKQFPKARIENIRTTQLDRNSLLVKEIVREDNNKYLYTWFILLAVITLFLEQWVWKKKLM